MILHPCTPSSLNTRKPMYPPVHKPLLYPALFHWSHPVRCSHPRNPNTIERPRNPQKSHPIKPIIVIPEPFPTRSNNGKQGSYQSQERKGLGSGSIFPKVGGPQMLALCGFGYWMQGFRCFPWLALNVHMAHSLSLCPSTLQLTQSSGNLPMVAKPFYGLLSDVLYVGGAHRIPYISVGVFLQVLSWGLLAFVPVAGKALPTLMACILISNLGASITEVAKDALTAEYGQKHRVGGLQSYAFMALAAGGILGNMLGGFFLLKTQPRTMFLTFTALLTLQLAISLATREDSMGLLPDHPQNQNIARKSLLENIREQCSNLMAAIRNESISHPLIWIVASISMVPILSGSLFCYQTQFLNLDPSILGMSRVIGQLILLSITVLYDKFWKRMPMRKLIGMVQVAYALSLLLDLILVKQINIKLGIPNEVFALCFSGIAETVAQFKILPFSVYLASLSPSGCEGSLTSFLASALCLASIVSGFCGVGLVNLIGITSTNYSTLPVAILVQFLAALVPLVWISYVPMTQYLEEKEKKKGVSKRTRRNRRVGRMVFDSVYAYRREREYDW